VKIPLSNLFKGYSHKVGLPPGTLVYVGEERTEPILINQIEYNQTYYNASKVDEINDIQSIQKSDTVTWVQIQGIHEEKQISGIGEQFGVDHLVLEDIMNPTQLPKIEEYDNYVFLILRTLNYNPDTNSISDAPLYLIVGSNYVISLQESGENLFLPIQNRIVNNQGRIRKMQAGYLAYTLIDLIIDRFFIVVEQINDQIELVEEDAITDPTPEILKEINKIRRQIVLLRKPIIPLRDVLAEILTEEIHLFNEDTKPFFRDVSDHIVQIIHTLDTLRLSASALFDTYSSSLNLKMNEIMKVLTLVATFFIPLTFITGLYGMNFQFMPELKLQWGYPIVLLVMVSVGITMFMYLKRKKWF